MALTNQQVQAAYLAIIGRPAEGSAVTWASGSFADLASLVSSIIDIRKGGDFSNNKETFVENLYKNLLGRPSDAEGKEFWLKALNDGASYAQVAQGFINAVLSQSQTADLYNLQNKLDVAEKISAQINTFQGGAAAEQSLKDLMTDVKANTTADVVDSFISDFKAQNVDIANVTVKPGAEEATKGSDEHATVFNASVTLGGDSINIQGSSSFADTLNLSVKGVKGEAESLTGIGTVSGIKTLNITTGSNVKTVTLGTDDIGGAKDLTIKGSAKSTITVEAGNNVSSITTGTASDYIDISAATNAVTVNGSSGIDTVEIGTSSAKATLVSIEKIAGTGNLSVAQLDGKTFTLGHKDDTIDKHAAITIDNVGSSGLNLSNLKIADTTTTNTFALKGVKGGTIKLKGEDKQGNKTTDAITITADAKKVDITNIDTTDTIVFSKLGGFAGSGGANALGASVSVAMSNNNAYLFNMNAGNITNAEEVAKALAAAGAKGTATAAHKMAVVVTDTNSKSAVWYVDQKDTQDAIAKGELQLLATFDAVADATDTLTNNAGATATFAFA